LRLASWRIKAGTPRPECIRPVLGNAGSFICCIDENGRGTLISRDGRIVYCCPKSTMWRRIRSTDVSGEYAKS